MAALLDRGRAWHNEIFFQRQTLLRAEGEVERGLSDIEATRLSWPRPGRDTTNWPRAPNEALAELVRIEAERAEAHLARSVLRVPAAGVLKEMVPRGAGNVIEPGALVAEILPEDAGMLASIEMPGEQIGGLRPGSRAWIKALVYDPALFGSITGSVRHISASSFRRQDGSMFFRIDVSLDTEYVCKPAHGMRVVPDMNVAVEIVTGEVSVLAWLARPVRSMLDSAFAQR